MKPIGFRGGMSSGSAPGDPPRPDLDSCSWSWTDPNGQLFLASHGSACHRSPDGSLAVLVRGHMRAARTTHGIPGARAAAQIAAHYEKNQVLPTDSYEGSYTIALLDGRRRRVLLYRNLAGAGFTYYTVGRRGLLFGGNLAELVEDMAEAPKPNRGALPAFFLYRFVPGRETLFDRVFRLMPGELIVCGDTGIARRQQETLARSPGAATLGPDAADRMEETLGAVVALGREEHPRGANLLSGGVDSTYLQALWNRAASGRPVSYSVSVDHAVTRLDTDYALSAACALNTDHRLVSADAPYMDFLIDTIAGTGEPPNHVMAAYFGHLARAMTADGVSAGMCGEGADSLFGISTADDLHRADILRRVLPAAWLRGGARAATSALGWKRLHGYLTLADRLYDSGHPEHPVNRVAAFADWDAVENCFGKDGIDRATAYRRELLAQYEVPNTPLDRLHAIGYLGEAVDSASLWTTLFNRAGADLFCPFLDSRILRLALSIEPRYRFAYRQPKRVLKEALARHVPRELAYRSKLGFGQPIFEWLAPGGQLRPWAERINTYDFVDKKQIAAALARPTWFLYSLLCYDTWHKIFIDRALPRLLQGASGRAEEYATSSAPL